MILLEYLFWILIVGFFYFMIVRLLWLYRRKAPHLFWKKKPSLLHLSLAAFFLLAAAALWLLRLELFALLPVLIAVYILSAASAVKVSERGIMADASLVRWPEITCATRLPEKNQIVIAKRSGWHKLRVQVPVTLEPHFRKMLAAKGIRVLEKDAASPAMEMQDFSVEKSC